MRLNGEMNIVDLLDDWLFDDIYYRARLEQSDDVPETEHTRVQEFAASWSYTPKLLLVWL